MSNFLFLLLLSDISVNTFVFCGYPAIYIENNVQIADDNDKNLDIGTDVQNLSQHLPIKQQNESTTEKPQSSTEAPAGTMFIPNFVDFNELASKRNGGKIIFATDDFFAVAENLLKEEDAVWKSNLYTTYGKWMDGWETRRKRIAGHDWSIIALGRPSIIRGVCVDTAFYTGNHAPRFSIQAARLSRKDENAFPKRISRLGSAATNKDFEAVNKLRTQEWTTLIPMTKLQPGHPETRNNYVEIKSNETWTHLRLNIFPDGGIARLRVYGFVKPDWDHINHNTLIDLLSMENGGVCVGFSNAHYGHPKNLIKPGRGINMGDGWETARKNDRPPILQLDSNGIFKFYGDEWALFKLGHVGIVSSIHVDTIHFKGNYPQNVKVEGAIISSNETVKNAKWKLLLTPQRLFPDKEHKFKLTGPIKNEPINHVKISMAPDGGISRVRIWANILHSTETS